MARLIYRLYNERTSRQAEVIRDRSNPLDRYNHEELIKRFFFSVGKISLNILKSCHQTCSLYQTTMQPRHPLCTSELHCVFTQTMPFKAVTWLASTRPPPDVTALRRHIPRYVYLLTEAELAVMKQWFSRPPAFQASWAASMRLMSGSRHHLIMSIFVNCKGYHPINACNANYNIFNLLTRWPGFTHDKCIHRCSTLYQDFEARRVNGLPLGNSSYPLKRWQMTPIMALRTEQELRYNTSHAATSSHGQNCISVLKHWLGTKCS